MIELAVTRLRPDAVLPSRAHDGDAGLDLTTCERLELRPGERAVAPTGLAIENSVTGSRVVLKAAPKQVVVHGLPSEVTMFVFGRQDHARVELLGPEEAVAALRDTSLGI